jgi:hypothetical protein
VRQWSLSVGGAGPAAPPTSSDPPGTPSAAPNHVALITVSSLRLQPLPRGVDEWLQRSQVPSKHDFRDWRVLVAERSGQEIAGSPAVVNIQVVGQAVSHLRWTMGWRVTRLV